MLHISYIVNWLAMPCAKIVHFMEIIIVLGVLLNKSYDKLGENGGISFDKDQSKRLTTLASYIW